MTAMHVEELSGIEIGWYLRQLIGTRLDKFLPSPL